MTLLLAACASAPYEYGVERMPIDKPLSPAMGQQILIGRPHKFLDASDWIWPGSWLAKLLLWDKDMDSHQISPATIDVLEQYIKDNELENVQVLVNQYSPGNQWQRLFRNRTVGAGWRYTLGILSVVQYTAFPGRFFGGDAYNPFTNSIYLYSDNPAVFLHEAGHAKDFAKRKYKGSHGAAYLLPFVALYYEAKASSDALGYYQDKGHTEGMKEAYEILYPAYSTYVGGNLAVNSVQTGIELLALIPGHIAGQIASANVPERDRADELTAQDVLPVDTKVKQPEKGEGNVNAPTKAGQPAPTRSQAP